MKGQKADGFRWQVAYRPRPRGVALFAGCLAAAATALGPVGPAFARDPQQLTLISPPTVSGTAQVGQTLTESHSQWNVTPFAFTYQWEDCDSSGQHCQSIGNATTQSYVVATSDAGHSLRVAETVFTSLGLGQAVSAVTALVSPPSVRIPTTTSLTSVQSSAVSDQLVTLIATVTSSSPATAPSGTLTFQNSGAPIGGCQAEPVQPKGQSVTVTCQTSFAASTAQLTAVFTPATGSVAGGSTSAPETFAVQPAPTGTSVSTSSHSVRLRARATFLATVQTSYLGPLTPSQTVGFFDNGQPIAGCTGQPLAWSGAAGVASCSVSYTLAGQHLITARYNGDANFAGSTSSAGALIDAVAGRVHPSLSWTFYYTPAYTKVLGLMVGHVLRGARVQVTCVGRGCPHRSRAVAVRHSTLASDGVSLAAVFAGRRLRPGAVITVIVERRGWIGKRYVFKVRACKAPIVAITCQAPGMAAGVGC